jgi:hypothetical protein
VTEAKRKMPTVHAPAGRLVEALLSLPRYDIQAAAEQAGMSVREARVYLGKHHVIAYYRAEKSSADRGDCAWQPGGARRDSGLGCEFHGPRRCLQGDRGNADRGDSCNVRLTNSS